MKKMEKINWYVKGGILQKIARKELSCYVVQGTQGKIFFMQSHSYKAAIDAMNDYFSRVIY